uniref:PepSY domain-containing protein n=1 Tax=Methylobacterium sp. B1 TaxID=91459 RepID=UPI0005B8CB94
MAWLHTWSGLVVGWVLFAIFVTGTASYYRSDISRWMRPELSEEAPDPVAAATRAGVFLRKTMPDAAGWSVKLPNAEAFGRRGLLVAELGWALPSGAARSVDGRTARVRERG